jgi:hypothetical protein
VPLIHVRTGSDTYGKVKKVGRTPIVTKFQMLQSIPIWPLQSYYFRGRGPVKREGIPFFFETLSSEIKGLPLERLDRFSVSIAYIRGICGVLFVLGFVSIVPLISYLRGERFDDFAVVFTRLLVTFFLVGLIGGSLTYLIGSRIDERERNIRLFCGEILGICADPARIRTDVAARIERAIGQRIADDASGQSSNVARIVKRNDLLNELVQIRAQIAIRQPEVSLERRTDELLEHIRHT